MGNIYDEVRVILHAIWRRRWIALAIAWIACLAGWLVVSQIPNKYASTSRVQFQFNSIITGDGLSEVDQQRGVDQVRQSLASAVNLTKVVKNTELANTVSSEADVADRVASLQKAIKVTAVSDNMVEISAEADSPRLARAIVQKLVEIFVEGDAAGSREQTQQSISFLDKQLNEMQARLSTATAKRTAFQEQYMGALPGTGPLDDRIAAARAEISDIDQQLIQAGVMLSSANAQAAATPATTPGGPGAVGPARARLNLVAGQIADARGRGFTDAHPDMIALRQQYAAALAAARAEPAGGGAGAVTNPSYAAARATVADRQAAVQVLQERRALIQGNITRIQNVIATNPDAATQQDKIERNYQSQKDQYNKLLQARQDVALRGDVQADGSPVQFSVIDPPTYSAAPASPNRPLLLTGVLAAGILAGIGVAFALGQLKTTYPNTQRLEQAAGLPVIGAIGEVVTKAQTALRRQRLRMFAGAAAGLLVAYVALIGVEFLQRGLTA